MYIYAIWKFYIKSIYSHKRGFYSGVRWIGKVNAEGDVYSRNLIFSRALLAFVLVLLLLVVLVIQLA